VGLTPFLGAHHQDVVVSCLLNGALEKIWSSHGNHFEASFEESLASRSACRYQTILTRRM